MSGWGLNNCEDDFMWFDWNSKFKMPQRRWQVSSCFIQYYFYQDALGRNKLHKPPITGCTINKKEHPGLMNINWTKKAIRFVPAGHCGRPNQPCLFHPSHANSNKHSTAAGNVGSRHGSEDKWFKHVERWYQEIEKHWVQIEPKHLKVEHQLWIDQSESKWLLISG